MASTSGYSEFGFGKSGTGGRKEAVSDIEADFQYGTTVATSMDSVRVGFIQKVYGILAAQLLLTTAVAALCMLVGPIRDALVAGRVMMIVFSIAAIGTLVALMFLRERSPLNMYLLATFTLFESLSVGTICAIYESEGAGYLVLEAFALTLLVFGSLTAYCHISKKDFSFLGGFLFASIFVLIGAGFINLILGLTGNYSPWFSFLISCAGVLIFTGYILFDTSLIIQKLSPDEYILAAVNLYLDILNLFLYILQLLAQAQDRN